MKRSLFFLPSLAWAIIVLWLSLLPGSNLPKWWFFEAIHIDKIVHLIMYGILSFLLIIGYMRSRKIIPGSTVQLTVLLFTTAYGVLIEILQETLTTNRHFEWGDILMDTIGAVLGVLLARYALKKKMFLRLA